MAGGGEVRYNGSVDRSDADLLEAWSGGDDEAGNMLVRRHFPAVYRFFAGKVQVGVDDLLQTTFLACMRLRDRFRGDASFRTFLLGVARIELLRYLRAKDRRRELTPERDSIADLEPTAFEMVEAQREQQVLLKALRRIPVDFQIAMELHYWEHMSIAEIAAVTEVAPGTVKSRLSRGRELARRQIEQMALEPELRKSTLDGFDRWAESLQRVLAGQGDAADEESVQQRDEADPSGR